MATHSLVGVELRAAAATRPAYRTHEAARPRVVPPDAPAPLAINHHGHAAPAHGSAHQLPQPSAASNLPPNMGTNMGTCQRPQLSHWHRQVRHVSATPCVARTCTGCSSTDRVVACAGGYSRMASCSTASVYGSRGRSASVGALEHGGGGGRVEAPKGGMHGQHVVVGHWPTTYGGSYRASHGRLLLSNTLGLRNPTQLV